jgi:hypothetical protein
MIKDSTLCPNTVNCVYKIAVGATSSDSDIDHCVIIRKSPDSVFNKQWEPNHHTGDLIRYCRDHYVRDPPSLLSNRWWGLFCQGQSGRGVKLTTRLQLVPRSREVSYTSTPPYVFMTLCLTKNMDKFTFTFESHLILFSTHNGNQNHHITYLTQHTLFFCTIPYLRYNIHSMMF